MDKLKILSNQLREVQNALYNRYYINSNDRYERLKKLEKEIKHEMYEC